MMLMLGGGQPVVTVTEELREERDNHTGSGTDGALIPYVEHRGGCSWGGGVGHFSSVEKCC